MFFKTGDKAGNQFFDIHFGVFGHMKVAVTNFLEEVFVKGEAEDMFFVLDCEGGLVTQLETLFRNLDNRGISPGNTFFDGMVVEELGSRKKAEVTGI